MHKPPERGDAGECDGYAGGDHGEGIAQDEPDGGASGGAEGDPDPDLARAAGDHKRHHAVEADQREQEGESAETGGKRSEHALGVQGAVDLLVEGAEGHDGQLWVGITDDLADGLEGLFGRAAYLDVKRAAEVIAFEDREEDLLGIFAEVAITEIGDHANDDGLRLDIGAGALTDEDAEGIDARKIAADERLVDNGGAAPARLARGTDVATVEVAAGNDADAKGGEEAGANGVLVDVAIGYDPATRLDDERVAPASAG